MSIVDLLYKRGRDNMNKPVKEYGFKTSPDCPATDISLQDTLEALQEKWMLYTHGVGAAGGTAAANPR